MIAYIISQILKTLWAIIIFIVLIFASIFLFPQIIDRLIKGMNYILDGPSKEYL